MSTINIGEYIKKVRNEKGLSSRKLAEISGVSQPYISQLETGKNKNPSIEILNKLSKSLDIPNGNLLIAAGYIDDPFDQFLVANEQTGELEIHDIKDLKSKGEIELPTYIFIKDKNGGETTKRTTLDDVFDLFYLLRMNIDIRFNRHQLKNEPPLTEEEKKAILDFTGYLINKRKNKE